MRKTTSTTLAEVKPVSLSLDLADAGWFARALLAGASTDDVTPVICAAHIAVTDGRLEGTSTDRYRVHQAWIEHDSVKGDSEFVLTTDSLKWIVKNVAYFGRAGSFNGPKLSVTVGDGLAVLSIARSDDTRSISFTDNLVKGNFPPVGRLIETALKAEVTTDKSAAIKLDFIAKARALASDPHEFASFKYTATENSLKPGPLLLTFRQGRALIQPNLNPGGVS